MDRIIMHMDMNAFFASVEQRSNPKLRGMPIAVVGSEERTVITSPSYEARAYGVKTGMTKYEAQKKCKDIIFVAGDISKYIDASARIINILKKFTPYVEVFSIDEAFLDITNSLILFQSAENIAAMIKKEIKEDSGLLCSIGIAPNKLLAKLASDLKKPDGLVIIKKEDVSALLETLPVSKLCGIGDRTEESLNMLGIKTCGDLGRYPLRFLKKRFGVVGETLHNMGLGIDNSSVLQPEEEQDVKSVGHSITLPKDISDLDLIHKHLLKLSEGVGRRTRKYGYCGKTVTLTIRYKDFSTFSKQKSINEYIYNTQDIYKVSLHILNSIKLTQQVRLLGVTLSNLVKYYHQFSLFEEENKKNIISKAIDEINEKYGDYSVTYGSLVNNKRSLKCISPSYKPDGARSLD